MTYRVQAFAALTGVTVRTLHHYDRLGLLVARRRPPARADAAGQRLYADSDVARLEHILALRTLGFSLRQIRAVLDRRLPDLKQRLRAQQILLEAKRVHLDRALAAVERALHDTRPETEVLAVLTKALHSMPENHDWTDQYYSAEAKAKLAAHRPAFTPAMQAEVSRQWAELAAEVEAAMRAGLDPAGAPVQMLAARWRTLVEAFTRRDPDIAAGLNQLWADRAHWPEAQQQRAAAFTPALMAYIRRAL